MVWDRLQDTIDFMVKVTGNVQEAVKMERCEHATLMVRIILKLTAGEGRVRRWP